MTIIATAAVAAAVGGFLLASGSGAAAPPNPNAIVLKASQVGAGYKSAVIPGGRQVAGQVTLDLCYDTYASEGLRTARLQEVYVKGGRQPAVSNEVVIYRAGGAAAALSELQATVTHCPATPRTGPSAGEQVPVSWQLTPITVPHVGLPYVAVRAQLSGVVNGVQKSMTSFIVYEFKGDVMSGVYGYENGASAPATQAFVVHAAQQVAGNLG